MFDMDLIHPPAGDEALHTSLAPPPGHTTLVRRHQMGSGSAGEPIRVLLDDDDAADQALVARALAAGYHSFEVVTISDPIAARRAIVSGEHDAFLIDWNLDGRAGIDVITDLRAAATGPMIAITGSDSRLVLRAAQRAGAFDFVPKDEISPELLSRTIRYAVQAWGERNRFQDMFDRYPSGCSARRPTGRSGRRTRRWQRCSA